jgi:hypothetical protein
MGMLTIPPQKHRLLRAKHDAIKIIWAWRRSYRQGVLKLMGPKIIQSYNVCFRRVSPIMEGWHLSANLRHTTRFLSFFWAPDRVWDQPLPSKRWRRTCILPTTNAR